MIISPFNINFVLKSYRTGAINMNKDIAENLKNQWIDKRPNKPLPHNIPVTWFDLSCLEKIDYDADRVTLSFLVNNKEYKLYLSFPEIGGIRLYSDKIGFQNIEKYKKIKCISYEHGLNVKTDSEIEIRINTNSNCWEIEILYDGKIINCINGRQLLLGYSEDGNLSKIKIIGSISEKELFTGLGERFDKIVRNGTYSLLWNFDSLFQLSESSKTDRVYSYTNIPILHSTNGYTLFINSSYAIDADIGKTNSQEYFFECYGPTFDLFFFTGEFSYRMESYAKLTGYNVLPPKWAFSYWAGNSAIHFTYANGGNYMQTLENMMEGYAKIGTPIKNMFVEGVIHKDKNVYKYLNKTDTHVIAWHDSAYWLKNKPNEMSIEDSPHLRPYYGDRNEELKQKYCDFTHPNAKWIIDNLYGKYIKLGIKGAMIDFADAVPYNSIAYDGTTGDEMHNVYAFHYQKHFKELYEKYNGSDYILFARAGFPGTQSLMAKFLGDEPCTFDGLKTSLTAGLNLSLSGFSLWGTDMGGLGIWRKHIPDEDCYRRWMQWAAFNPIMRSHGHTTRAPWDFSSDAVRDFQKYYWLRENLMDTIYSNVIDSSRSATVMVEPLQLAFPQDETVALIEDEYMFCKDILVAPILKERTLARDVILPNGMWIDFWTGLNVKGGAQFKARASEGTIPLYLRSGTLLKIKLSYSLKLCDNMEKGSYNALLITAPDFKRDISFNLNEIDVERYITEFIDGKTVITNSSMADINAVIAKGISAISVIVDGKAVDRKGYITPNGTAFYYVDEIKNTTTIFLPDSWKTLEIVDSGKVVKNLAFEKFIYSEDDTSASFHRTIADGWAFNYWTIPRTNAKFTLDLDEVKEIKEIQMTWGTDYADSYMVEASVDGKNWFFVIGVMDGTGDEEVLRLPPNTKARYIRFMNFGFPQRTPAILGDIRVYGTEYEDKD